MDHPALSVTCRPPLGSTLPVGAALLAMLGAPVQAAQSPAVPTLAPVAVSATADATTEGTGSYAAAASSIGKTEQEWREIPRSVTTVTRQRMDDQDMRTLNDALERTTGITVQQSNNYQRTFSSRGFTLDTVQLDGVPTQINDSQFLLPTDLAIYDHVEVLRGPDGIFNGNGQAGGTVNLVRKRPGAERMLNADLSVGSWRNRRGVADVGGPLNAAGTLRGRLVAVYENREYFYDVADSDKQVVYGALDYDLTPATTVGVGLAYERAEMTPFYGGLPRFSDGRDLGLPRDTYLNAAWSRVRIEKTTAFADLTHRFNDDWKLRVAATHQRENNHDRSGSAFGTVNPVALTGPTLSAFDADIEGRQTGVDASLNGAFEALGRRHEVIVGANLLDREGTTLSRTMYIADPNVDPFDFDPYDYRDFPTELSPARAPSNTTTESRQWGAYGVARLTITEPLRVIVGARVSRYESRVRNNLTGALSNEYDEKGEVTPYGAVTYDLTGNWTAYVSYAEIFRSQANRYRIDGSPLAPATGSNYEAGVKGSFRGGRLNAGLALFRIEEKDRALADPNAPDPCPATPTGTGACYVNAGEVRSQGFEAEISGNLTPAWSLFAGYTYNTTKILRDAASSEGTPLSTYTPRHMLRLWTDYRLPGRWDAVTLGGGVNLQSSTYKTGGALRFSQGGYAIWSARASYRINPNLTAALHVNNLFDKHYYGTLGSERGSNWYGEPRSVMLTLHARY